MDLQDLPHFTISSIEATSDEERLVIRGRFSHLAGVRNERGWLYRGATSSLIGDLEGLPATVAAEVTFVSPDVQWRSELRVGARLPWIDGYWQAYHVDMILADDPWERRQFLAQPARYFTLKGVPGWQPLGGPLPEGAIDRGVRDGRWDHEHCEICNAVIGRGGQAIGYVDAANHWLCEACHTRHAARRDLSFIAGP